MHVINVNPFKRLSQIFKDKQFLKKQIGSLQNSSNSTVVIILKSTRQDKL